jgi:ribulose bisphosphate carboxylase small subunit
MARYFFYSADLFTRDDTQLTGGYHGVMTIDDDAKSAAEVFGEITDMLQQQTQDYIRELSASQQTDPGMFYFIVKQFYRVE